MPPLIVEQELEEVRAEGDDAAALARAPPDPESWISDAVRMSVNLGGGPSLTG